MVKKKWIYYLVALVMIFSLFSPSIVSKAKIKIDGQSWYSQPKSIKISKTKDYLQYGKLSKGSSYIGGIVRNYNNNKAYIISQSTQMKSWVEEASIYSAYEKFEKNQKGKFEMGVALGYQIDKKGNKILSYLPVLDTTPSKDENNSQKFIALPKKEQLKATYKNGKKTHNVQAYNIGRDKIDSLKKYMTVYVDGKLVAQSDKNQKIKTVLAFWGETGIGNNSYINKLKKNNKKIKNYTTHQRPYILAYKKVNKNGVMRNQWELYTPKFNGDGGKGYLKNLIKVHSFKIDGMIAKDFDSKYLQENVVDKPIDTPEEEIELIKNKFDLKADKTTVSYGQFITLSLHAGNNTDIKYNTNWKVTDGTLTVAEDGKSAIWKSEQNVTKEAIITVTIEATLKTGEKITFDKSIVIKSASQESSNNNNNSGNDSNGNNSEGSTTQVDDDKDGLSNQEEAIIGTNPSKSDTDGDGLKDGEEVKTYKTNPLKADTDIDGLSDGEEVFLYNTNPLKKDSDADELSDSFEVSQNDKENFNPLKEDSDGNGVLDGNEDVDKDGLSNKQEQDYKTNPLKADTDVDGISDGKEIEDGLNPLKDDSDEDKLIDGEESELGFDPTKPDTDGNGILDGDELIDYTAKPNAFNQSKTVNPSVTFNTKASEGSSTIITSLEGDPFLNKNIPGYIGPGFDFKTDVEFSEAKMTFSYDESVITEGFKPEIFYYNETSQRLEKLSNQVHNVKNHSVTATVSHFSKYILLDGDKWDKVWEKEIKPPSIDDNGVLKNLDVVFSIDSSGSMSWMDPNGLRKTATKNFVDALREKDRSAVVDFDDYGKILINLTEDKDAVKMKIDTIDSSGGTDIYVGVQKAIEEIINNSSEDNVKYVILLTDGDGYWNDSAIQNAKDHNIAIFTIGLGNGVNKNLLEKIAKETGGKYFFASDASELEKVLKDTAGETIDYTIDNDENVGDGIPDYLEKDGLRIGNGEVYHTDPMKLDTDGDGLLDGEEMTVFYDDIDGKIYFKMYSNPLEKDSDGDGLEDGEEQQDQRMTYNVTPKHALMFSELSYINMEDEFKTTDDMTELAEFSHNYADSKKDLVNWKLIKANDNENGFLESGFGAIAAKHGDSVIISYRGSDTDGAGNIFTDWVKTNADILVDGDTPQLDEALEFAAEVIHDNPTSKIYVVGHSMGGFNAQVVSYHLKENTLANIYSWFSGKRKKKIKKALDNGNYKLTRTFNSAPFFGERALDPLGIDMNTSTHPAVPLDKVWGHDFDSKIYNYQMSFDILNVLGSYLPSEKLGQEFKDLDYKINNKVYTYKDFDFQFLVDLINDYETNAGNGQIDASNRIELARELTEVVIWVNKKQKNDLEFKEKIDDFLKSSEDLIDGHSLVNFYPYLNQMQ